MAEPTFMSAVPAGTSADVADIGAKMMGFEVTPQGRNLAMVLESADADGLPLYPTVGVLMPRRSTKTTSLWSVILGRCATRENYRVVTTAQDGTRAGQKMREVMRSLQAQGLEEAGAVKLEWSNGREVIGFPETGSRI